MRWRSAHHTTTNFSGSIEGSLRPRERLSAADRRSPGWESGARPLSHPFLAAMHRVVIPSTASALPDTFYFCDCRQCHDQLPFWLTNVDLYFGSRTPSSNDMKVNLGPESDLKDSKSPPVYQGAYPKRFQWGATPAEIMRDVVKWLSLCVVLIVIIIIIRMEYVSTSKEADNLEILYDIKENCSTHLNDSDSDEDGEEFVVDPFSLEEVFLKVYKPNKLYVDFETKPLITLGHIGDLKCDALFDKYEAEFSNYTGTDTPPEMVEEGAFSMFGMGSLKFDQITVSNHFSNETVLHYEDKYDFTLLNTSTKLSTTPAGLAAVALFHAFGAYPITNMHGAVFKTDGEAPWVENFAISFGASDVLVLEERQVISNLNDSVEYKSMLEISRDLDRYASSFDFIVSFAQLGQLGLGKEGEPLDPSGDLAAVRRLSCLLRPGGVLYLAEAAGQDSVHFNQRRVYGRIRFPMLLAGFEVLSIFLNGQEEPITLSTKWIDQERSKLFYTLFVLRKK